MTRKVLSFFAAMLIGLSMSVAQDDMSVIGDELTQDPEQNAQWREGQNPYPAKPKSMWELGLYGGLSIMSGDVDADLGYNVGLTARKSISYVLSVRFGGNYSVMKGYDARPTNYGSLQKEPIFANNGGAGGALGGYENSNIHRNFQTNVISGNLELLISIGNIMFHRPDPKWNAYIGFGVGYVNSTVEADLLNGTSVYNFDPVTSGLDLSDKDDRNTAQDRVKDLLDGEWESEGGDDPTTNNASFQGIGSLGITRRLGDRVNIGLEYQLLLTGSDLLDGWQADSRSADLVNNINLRIGFNLGSKEKRVEPLYWVNPLDATANDIAELKQRPKFDLTDSDGDGVIDMIDQERETTAGCPVDTRGIILDSDGDGVPDCKDEEPFSPPGYSVNDKGVANVTTPYLTESEIRTIVNERPLPKTEWFLPMIHFDLDKYYIKPMYYGQLLNVATVAKSHPNLKFVASGYSDNRGDDEYNNVLAYNRAEAAVNYIVANYGVSRDRFVLKYGGDQMVQGLPSNYNTTEEQEKGQYMNRRVEFKVAADGDSEMSRPEGEAGSDTPGSARTGAKYSGNRNSGY